LTRACCTGFRNDRQLHAQKKHSLAHSRWYWIAYQTPESWDDKPNMKRQKHEDARWTRRHGKSYYSYKNHIKIDK